MADMTLPGGRFRPGPPLRRKKKPLLKKKIRARILPMSGQNLRQGV